MISRLTFIDYCLSFIGTPYIYGGDDPFKGLDCSGLTQLLLARLGLDPVGDQSAEMLRQYCQDAGYIIDTLHSDLGDVVFFGTALHAVHVGVIVHQGIMIEAAGGGPSILTIEAAKAVDAKVELNRISRRKDLSGIYRLRDLKWV